MIFTYFFLQFKPLRIILRVSFDASFLDSANENEDSDVAAERARAMGPSSSNDVIKLKSVTKARLFLLKK